MLINAGDDQATKPFIDKLRLPHPDSHKGQNGRALVIGGSGLFHAASIWAAEIATYFVDIVHYCSTKENEQVSLSLKKKFLNGIIIPKKDLPLYVQEDDAILAGPGMVRTIIQNSKIKIQNFEEILSVQNEGEYTYLLTKYLIENFPNKKLVFDAGALQMMESSWLLKLAEKPILTPHQKEFEQLFGCSISEKPFKEKVELVQQTAKKFNSIILLKAIDDIVSDGDSVAVIRGGNAGLTKGGTGDILAGLNMALYTKNDPMTSAVVSSVLLKRTAAGIYQTKGYWYNIDDIISFLPQELKSLI